MKISSGFHRNNHKLLAVYWRKESRRIQCPSILNSCFRAPPKSLFLFTTFNYCVVTNCWYSPLTRVNRKVTNKENVWPGNQERRCWKWSRIQLSTTTTKDNRRNFSYRSRGWKFKEVQRSVTWRCSIGKNYCWWVQYTIHWLVQMLMFSRYSFQMPMILAKSLLRSLPCACPAVTIWSLIYRVICRSWRNRWVSIRLSFAVMSSSDIFAFLVVCRCSLSKREFSIKFASISSFKERSFMVWSTFRRHIEWLCQVRIFLWLKNNLLSAFA